MTAVLVLIAALTVTALVVAASRIQDRPQYPARHARHPQPPGATAPGRLPMLPEKPPWPQDDTWWDTPAAAAELLAALKEPVPADTRADLPAVSLTARYLP